MAGIGDILRPATFHDATEACDIVRRSIVELCSLDHGHDEDTVAAWLANKTPANVERWIRAIGSAAWVVERNGHIVGFGLLQGNGRLALLYVAPEARFQGVSHALLEKLEACAMAAGHRRVRLASSHTARRFYAARGYSEDGALEPGFGTPHAYPMSKVLAP